MSFKEYLHDPERYLLKMTRLWDTSVVNKLNPQLISELFYYCNEFLKLSLSMKRLKMDLHCTLKTLAESKKYVVMKKIQKENLDIDYGVVLPSVAADEIFDQLERTVEYYDQELTKVRVFGKWHQIPRQQVAYGDEGMTYAFSGVTIPAKPWIPLLRDLRTFLTKITGFEYNFVLVNRYRNGNDHMGEHKDDEKELDHNTPIASLTLGQERTFVLKHGDTRKKGDEKRNIPPVKIDLQHGSLLLMNHPTNEYWYHSLPVRKSAGGVRINLTFRKLKT